MNKPLAKTLPTAPPDDLPLLCRACTARHGGICSVLDARHLTELSQASTRRSFAGGTELSAFNDGDSSFANVLGGVIKLSKLLPDGRQQIVGLQFAPDFVGRPFAEQGEGDLIAEAVTDVTLCAFSRRVLERMIDETPGLERRLYQQALAELAEARDLLLTLGRKSAREKVATFLLMIARHAPERDENGRARARGQPSPSFEMPLSRLEIADFLGLTIETVSRQLTKLKVAGLIRMEKTRYIVIPDLDALAEAAGD